MKIFATSPFAAAAIPGRIEHPRHSLTLIVKGTFAFDAEGIAAPVETPAFPCGDDFYPDDGRRESVRYESDFAWFKPMADLLLVGKCHAPGGTPVSACSVTFQVGSRSRSLAVFGDRRWRRNALGLWKLTEPEPFTAVDLRYENSFGGEGYEDNPVGRGLNEERDLDGGKIRALPNIEDPDALIDSPRRRPMPAGFGPLNRGWRERRSRMGTCGDAYSKKRWPWLPEDFDWGHFNAAPPEMQVAGYLRGDETLYFENLHPEHPQYRSRLPGIRVRCFLNRAAESGAEGQGFEEVAMNLDTLWVDMEAGSMALVWRGWAPVRTEDHEEVSDLFILPEPLERPPAPLEECRQMFGARKAEEDEGWAEEAEAPEVPGATATPAPPPGTAPEPVATSGARADREVQEIQSQVDALLLQMGIDPGSLSPEARARQARMIRTLKASDPARAAEMERREIDHQMRGALAGAGLDPDHLPPVSAKARAEQMRLMKELGITPADVAAGPEYGRMLDLMGAVLTRMGMDPENLDPLIDQAKAHARRLGLPVREDATKAADDAGAARVPPLVRETVGERSARGESFAGEDLRGLDLSGLDLSNVDLSEANMAGVNLTGTALKSSILAGADLSGARLSGADFTGADCSGADLTRAEMRKSTLKGCDLTGSLLVGADLTGAVLADALFERARMPGAALNEVEARDANFSEADLTECSFRSSSCSRADFSHAVLDGADFRGADLREASVDGSKGRKINLAEADITRLRASDGCDFTGGVFWNAVGPGSIWEHSDLTGSDFRGARMEGAVFTAACLAQADLSASDMKFGRFTRANLRGARLVRMNLFQGTLEKADLTGADLSGSNMYGVEFLDAAVEGIATGGTNLQMSKLQ